MMAMNQMSEMGAIGRAEAESLSRNWWLLLVNGILSAIAGIIILSIPWTLATLAFFVGAVLIIRGIFQALSPSHIGRSRAWNATVGVLSILVGIGVLASPAFAGFTLLFLAFLIGAWLIVSGVANIAGSISARDTLPYWWLSLTAGIISVPLGIFALYRPILTLDVAIVVVGIWALVVGIAEIALSFEIRRLPQVVERREKELERMEKRAA